MDPLMTPVMNTEEIKVNEGIALEHPSVSNIPEEPVGLENTEEEVENSIETVEVVETLEESSAENGVEADSQPEEQEQEEIENTVKAETKQEFSEIDLSVLTQRTSNPLLKILDKPVYLVSLVIECSAPQSMALSPETLGLTAEEVNVLKQNRITSPRVQYLKVVERVIGNLKTRRAEFYRGLFQHNNLWFCTEEQLQSKLEIYNDIRGVYLEEKKELIRAEYYNEIDSLTSRVMNVLQNIRSTETSRRLEILNNLKSRVPTLDAVLNGLTVSLNGPFKIPSLKECIHEDNELQELTNEAKELACAEKLQQEFYEKSQEGLIKVVNCCMDRVYEGIVTEIGKLQKARANGRFSKNPHAFSHVLEELKSLESYVSFEGGLSEILLNVENSALLLNEKQIDAERVNESLNELLLAASNAAKFEYERSDVLERFQDLGIPVLI